MQTVFIYISIVTCIIQSIFNMIRVTTILDWNGSLWKLGLTAQFTANLLNSPVSMVNHAEMLLLSSVF